MLEPLKLLYSAFYLERVPLILSALTLRIIYDLQASSQVEDHRLDVSYSIVIISQPKPLAHCSNFTSVKMHVPFSCSKIIYPTGFTTHFS